MMAAAAVEDDSLAALQARVVASGGPPAAKAGFAREWLRFQDASMPAWAIGPNGKLSLNAPASATRADAYAGFFKPRFVEGRMKLQCLLCDEKPCSFHVVDSKGDDVFPFANAFGHLATCGGLRCLRECDFGEAKGKVVKASSSADIGRAGGAGGGAGSSAGGGAGGSAGTKRDASHVSVENHLQRLGLDDDTYRMLALRFMLADARPLGTLTDFGMHYFLKGLHLPTPSRQTMTRLFNREL